MQAPVDYPIIDRAHDEQFSVDELSYAALLDRMDSLSPDTDDAVVEAPVFTFDEAERAATRDRQLLKPVAVFAQTMLARNQDTLNIAGYGSGETSSMFSRWSRALR